MTLAEISNIMAEVIDHHGNPSVAKTFTNEGVPVALAATITVGGVTVR